MKSIEAIRNNEKYIILVISVFLVISIGINLQYSSKISYLELENKKLENLSSSLNIIELENQIASLKLNISFKESEIVFMNLEKDRLQNTINGLDDQIQILNNRIVDKQTKLDARDQLISSLNDDITYLENEVHQLENTESTIIGISFSRTEDTSSFLRGMIAEAEETIEIMVMCITQNELADSLVSAHNRGVEVTVIIDDNYESSSGSDYSSLFNSGLNIRVDNRSGLMHHKVMIIDREIVVIGSYNWSASAEDNNDENVIAISSDVVVTAYLQEFNRIYGQTSSSSSSSSSSTSTAYNGPFWASKNSDIYHKPSCYWAKQISSSNLLIFNTRAQAETAGYRPCYVCEP